MTEKIILLLVGGFIGLVSSLATAFFNAYIQSRKQKSEQQYQDSIRKDSQIQKELEVARDFVTRDNLVRITGEGKITELKPRMFACLGEDTMVRMSNDSTKAVQDIKIGDELTTFNEREKQLSRSKVSNIGESIVPRFIEINNKVKVSETHQFLTKDGLIHAINLKVGQFILCGDLSAEEVLRIELVYSPLKVFAVTLKDEDYLIAAGYCMADFLSKISTKEEMIAYSFNNSKNSNDTI